MNIAHFTELFPKLSETFILNQIIGLINSDHNLRIFADRPADEPKRHPEMRKYRLDELITYTRPPRSYSEAGKQIVRTLFRHPTIAGELIESAKRGKSGGRRLANLQTALNVNMSKFDIYHFHFGDVGRSWDFLKMNAKFSNRTPFVVSFYGIDASKVIREDPNAYDQLFDIADVITVLSKDMEDTLVEVGCPKQKTTIQPLPIDTDKFEFHPPQYPRDRSFQIVTVARFDEQKGLRYAIDAVAEMVDDYDLTYSIAGDGPLFEEIRNRVHDRGIEDSVELLGWLDSDEVTTLMEEAHLFLLPSVTAPDGAKEGTPTVLLEAQAVGLPIVSTYHAGIPEIVDDGESGLLVPEKNVDALVDALERLLDNPDRWEEMGRHGRRQVIRNHSIPAVVEKLESIYSTNQLDE